MARALRPGDDLAPLRAADDGRKGKAVAGLDEVTRAALESAEEKILEDAQPLEDNVISLASRRS